MTWIPRSLCKSWETERPLWLLLLWVFGGAALRLSGAAQIPWWVITVPFLTVIALALAICFLFYVAVRGGDGGGRIE